MFTSTLQKKYEELFWKSYVFAQTLKDLSWAKEPMLYSKSLIETKFVKPSKY